MKGGYVGKKEKGTRFGRKEDKSNGGSRRCELCARGRSIRARNTPLFEGRPGNEGIAEVRSAGGCAGKLLVDVGERRLGDLLSRLEGESESEQAQRTLVIVNSVELAQQTAAMARRLRPDWTVEIEQGGKHIASGTANLYVECYRD